ncbi:TadE family protein [Streptomyces sp. KR80]|uniref:TadE family protein n=1 Tax=Streptomyces sp. KR80 TaxID=3457426 RepID=UPI003FD27B2D
MPVRQWRTDPMVGGVAHGGRSRFRCGSDRGQTAVEFIGFLPFLILIGMVVIQLGIAAYAIQQSGTAARTAARIASHDHAGDGAAAGKAAISDWLAGGTDITIGVGDHYDEVKATAEVRVPSIIPGLDFDPVQRSSIMPRD